MVTRRKKPPQAKAITYRGQITPARAAAGINAALRNARRLLADAVLLFKAESYATALSIAVLAIEECGKHAIIHRILIAKSDKQRKEHWGEYTTHTEKNVSWVVPNLVRAGASHIDDFKIIDDETSVHPFALDDFKQWGLYTDCREKFWSEPEKVVTPSMAFEVLQQAQALIRNTHEVNEEQLTVYVKHLSPVLTEDPRDADQNAVRAALESYFQECQQRGWLHADTDIHAFFHGSEPKSV
jgi:AbiV family abortive infection protein